MNGGAPVVESLLAAALIAASGLALVDLVPSLRARAGLASLGWAWLLGCAWLAGSSYAVSHVLHLPLRRGVVLPLALLPVFFAGWRRARGGSTPRAAGPPWTSLERGICAACLAFGFVVTLSLVADGLSTPVYDWDGKMIWVAQARFIRGAHSVDAPVLRDPGAWVVHPRYPVLLPVLQVAAQELTDAPWDDRFVRPLYALFWPAFLLVLFDAATGRASRTAALVAALAASCAPFLAFSGAASACSDLPLACFWGGGLFLLSSEGAALAEGAASGLLLGAAVLSKGEGLPLAAVALASALAWALAGRRVGSIRIAFLTATACAAAAAVLLASWRSGIPPRHDLGQFEALTLANFLRGATTRLPEAARTGLHAMADRKDWGLTWLLVPAGLALGARRLVRPASVPLALALAGALALYAAAYSLSVWPAALLARVTWSRFLVQMALILFVFLAVAIDTGPGMKSRPERLHSEADG